MAFPCRNGGTCFPIYDKDSYNCTCFPGYIGSHCETRKLKKKIPLAISRLGGEILPAATLNLNDHFNVCTDAMKIGEFFRSLSRKNLMWSVSVH